MNVHIPQEESFGRVHLQKCMLRLGKVRFLNMLYKFDIVKRKPFYKLQKKHTIIINKRVCTSSKTFLNEHEQLCYSIFGIGLTCILCENTTRLCFRLVLK